MQHIDNLGQDRQPTRQSLGYSLPVMWAVPAAAPELSEASIGADSVEFGTGAVSAASGPTHWQPDKLMPASLASVFQRAAKDSAMRQQDSPRSRGSTIPAFRPMLDPGLASALLPGPRLQGDHTWAPQPPLVQPQPQPQLQLSLASQHAGLSSHLHLPAGTASCAGAGTAGETLLPCRAAAPCWVMPQQQPQFSPVPPAAGLSLHQRAHAGCGEHTSPTRQLQLPSTGSSSKLSQWHLPAACITTGAQLPAHSSPVMPSMPAGAMQPQAGSALFPPSPVAPGPAASHVHLQSSPPTLRGSGQRRAALSSVSLEQLEKDGLFDLPIQEACKQLGVGLSVLKRVCRQKGLARWPYRTRQSLRGVIARTEEFYQGDVEEASTPKAEVVGALQHNLHALLGVEGQGLTKSVRKYRQSVFKLNYKLKRQEKQTSGCRISASAAAKVAQ